MPATLQLISPNVKRTAIANAVYGYTFINTQTGTVWSKKSKRTWGRVCIANGEYRSHTIAELLDGNECKGIKIYSALSDVEYEIIMSAVSEPAGTVAVNKSNCVIAKTYNGIWVDIMSGAVYTHKQVNEKHFSAVAVLTYEQ